MHQQLACGLIVALGAAHAHGAFFSFASDGMSSSWTFRYDGANFIREDYDQDDPPLNLLIDDDNGGLPALSIPVRLESSIYLEVATSTHLYDDLYLHRHGIGGDVDFIDATSGERLLSLGFDNAILVSIGSEDRWGSTATMQGTDTFAYTTYTWHGDDLPGYGLVNGELPGPADFAFTLTTINTSGQIPYDFDPATLGVALDAGGRPASVWWSEGSFSGSTVPTPGSLALLGLGALAGTRRRR